MDQLSSREREVLTLAETGMTDAQIAGRLGTAVSTVRNHFNSACKKLGAAHRFMCGVLVERGGFFTGNSRGGHGQ